MSYDILTWRLLSNLEKVFIKVYVDLCQFLELWKRKMPIIAEEIKWEKLAKEKKDVIKEKLNQNQNFLYLLNCKKIK